MADYIPPELEAQFTAFKRKQAIAQALQNQALQGQDTQVISGHAVPQGFLQNAIRFATGAVANHSLGEADTGLAGLNQQAATQRQEGIAKILAQNQTDPSGASNAAMSSPDPRAQAIGAQLMKQRQDQIAGFAGAIKDVDPTAAGRAFQTQQLPQGEYSAPAMPGPEFGTSPSGTNYGVTSDSKGVKHLQFEPKGTNITNTIDNAQKKMAFDTVSPEIKIRQEKAQLGVDLLRANSSALQAIQDGAKMGGGEGLKQSIRKTAQAFGVNLPDAASTEQLQMALGTQILANARKLAPVTGEDIKVLEKIVGSINSDPTALQRAIEQANAIGMKNVQDYRDYVKTAGSGVKDPTEKGLFDAQLIGFDQPRLSGNAAQQVRQMQALQSVGGDISQFNDPSGQAYAPDAQFNMKPPTMPASKGGRQKQLPGLTAAETAEYYQRGGK